MGASPDGGGTTVPLVRYDPQTYDIIRVVSSLHVLEMFGNIAYIRVEHLFQDALGRRFYRKNTLSLDIPYK